MTERENYLAIARRKGYEYMPVHLKMCPDLEERFLSFKAEHDLFVPSGPAIVGPLDTVKAEPEAFMKYYPNKSFKRGTTINAWGVAKEPGSAAAFHMTYMHHPMEDFDSVEQVKEYPFPIFSDAGFAAQKAQIEEYHKDGRAVMGELHCSIWEQAWYLRGMENLFCDMMTDHPIAHELFERVTDMAVRQIASLARAGADVIYFGDDIGMQHSIMMSEALYCEWLQPLHRRVIDAAKAENPDVLIFYHSCGHVTELIPHLIDAGIDVLNPVQPECMEFREIHERFGERISFHGTIGTQSVMPRGTPADVRAKVFENLDIAGKKGGLFVCPTHLLEPDVPVENVVAYIKACTEYCQT